MVTPGKKVRDGHGGETDSRIENNTGSDCHNSREKESAVMEFLLPLHITLMTVAVMLVIIAAVIAKRRKKNWFKAHRAFAVWGVLTSTLAFACIVGLKIAHHFHHFSSLHAVAGLVTLCLLLATPLFGASIPKGPKWIRPFHRTMGRITSIAIMLTAIMGVFRFLQINKG
jgi:hypothetical protein